MMNKHLVRGAVNLCRRPLFQQFLSAYHDRPIRDEIAAADGLRQACGIQSRAELRQCPIAADRYLDLVAKFNAWIAGRLPQGAHDWSSP